MADDITSDNAGNASEPSWPGESFGAPEDREQKSPTPAGDEPQVPSSEDPLSWLDAGPRQWDSSGDAEESRPANDAEEHNAAAPATEESGAGEPAVPVAPTPSSGAPIPYFSGASGFAGPDPLRSDGPADSSGPSAPADGGAPAEQPLSPEKKAGLFGFLKRKKAQEPEAAADATAAQPAESTQHAPGPEAAVAGTVAAAWAAHEAHVPGPESEAQSSFGTPSAPFHSESTAVGAAPLGSGSEPPGYFSGSSPAEPIIPAEKPGLFGFLKRKKTPEPEPEPWLPPETDEAEHPGTAGTSAASAVPTAATAAAAGAAAGVAAGAGVGVGAAADAAAGAGVGAGVAGLAAPATDPAAAQMTQLLPTVPGPADATAAIPVTGTTPPLGATGLAPPPVPEPLPAFGPMVPTGSRVVVVISRAASPVPVGPGVVVPKVVGRMQGDALGQLQANGLSAQVFNDFSNEPRGEVVAQLPEGGQPAPAGSEVVLLVSSGPAPVASLLTPLPDVVGLTEADALSKLQLAGLSPQIVRNYSPTVPLGAVIEQLPSARSMASIPKHGPSLWWLWLLLAFAVAAAVGGGVYYYLNRTATVPNIVGMPQSQAEQSLAAAGFKVGSISTTQTLSASQVGNVTSQTPEPGSVQKLTEPIDIVISGGQLLFTVPNVVSKPTTDAVSQIEAQGLIAAVSQSYSATIPVGIVGFQSPAPGEKVPTRTTVGIVVSLGLQNVAIPGVGNSTQAAATSAMKAAGLNVTTTKAFSPTVASGNVISVSPAEGTSVPLGSTVNLTVSKGPEMVTVPNVKGQKLATAQSTLSSSGFQASAVGSTATSATVSSQSPSSGASAAKGSVVTLTMVVP